MQTTALKLSILATLVASSAMAETNTDTTDLSTVEVAATSGNTLSEHSKSLTASAMSTTTGLVLSPKETPQSVSVVTKAHLDQRSVHNMEDALKTTTGINVISDAGYYRYQSRGFYIDQIEEDGISSTVRGSNANLFRDPQSMTDLAVYDHIEVVRGATGLTQANGEPGGTINAVRKRPTSEFQANGNFLFDTNGKARTMADVSGTIGAGVRGRLVSVLENDPTAVNLPSDNSKRLIYGVVDMEVGSNSQLTIGGLYQNTHTTPNVYGVPMGVNGSESGLDRDTYLGFNWNREKSRKFNLFAEFETFFNDDWKLNNKVSYTKSYNTDQFGFVANAGTSYTGLVRGNTINTNNLQRYDNTGDQIAFQSNLTGKYSLLGRKHDLFLGYTYNREENDSRWRRVRNSTAFDPFTFTGSEIAEPNWNTDYNDQTFYDRTIYTNAVSFGTRFNLLDDLHLLAGTRYTQWKRIGNTNYDWFNNKVDTDADEHSHLKRSRFVPYFGMTYDINANNSLYVSYTSIFKPNSGLGRDGKVIDPVLGNNQEIGWKGEWQDGKLNASIALFQINQKNRPVFIEDASYKGDGYYGTLGEVRSRGVDIEISGNITEDWQLMAGYTFNQSKYLETESSRYLAGTNFSKHTPKHMFRLYSDYNLPFDNKKWSIGAGVMMQSETESLYSVKQGGYAIWDANIRYQVSKNVALSVIGKNLTDKKYYENNRVRVLGANNFYGQERTVVFNLDWKI
ncbi:MULTISPECIES: TonB-dependent siderophore receptor [Glaesserella]|uniref:TonB-dependent siderophore receptor n=1 Tax=Glaesserella australis TaxID=2094024 RepID=A0A328BWF3_9PAST|nr:MULTISPECIES: TonB-dependent siderophore receptor [Glaesserella]AUI65137.1 TonB-dependent siderophore receptor [Glaesserella sp. 15-184]RAL18041.1 TonB-dependent siderophore receptor [Glaesserella australis]